MVDASEMMEFLPPGVDDPSFIEKSGPVRPGAEALWIEADVPEGLPSRPNIRRIGAMVHQSRTRTSFMNDAWTGAEHEYWIEAYARDVDGLSIRLEKDVRFRLDDAGFLTGLEFVSHQSIDFLVKLQGDAPSNLATAPYFSTDQRTAFGIEVTNRVFFSLALMNCRNVSLRERGSRKTTVSAATGDAFHEVVIDSGSRGPAGAGGEVGDGGGRRHLARGHFKTFTEDAPLLGKHVGTYWWGWQVRGQEGKGSIERTYALKGGRS